MTKKQKLPQEEMVVVHFPSYLAESRRRRATKDELRAALEGLLHHIDHVAYRDQAGLRLSDVVPCVETARTVLANAK